jgi:anti-anti-sigma factor
MHLHFESGNDRNVLRQEGEFNIYGVVEFRDALLKAIAAEGDLDIDLTGASEVDAAGLQLLLLARSDAGACGKKLRITGASPALLDVMQLCNVTGWFEFVPAEHAAAQGSPA